MAEESNPTHVTIGTAASEGALQHDGTNITDMGGGDDAVNGRGGVNIIDTGSGDDSSINTSPSSEAWDVVMGGSGDDFIIGPQRGFLNARGGSGRDIIIGGRNSDYIFGGDDDDLLLGGGGDDIIVGGKGDDIMGGGSGADTFVFGPGDGSDTIMDFENIDTLDITSLGGTITWNQLVAKISASDDGNNTVIDLTEWGGGTITLLFVDPASLTADMFALPNGDVAKDASAVFQDPDVNTVFMGTSGNDIIDLSGSTENLVVTGGEGDDVISTGSGHDILKGGEGDDILSGGAGSDLLMGGEGDDTLYGEDGDDTLIGGQGDDTMTGGAGADAFVFGQAQGNDTVTDFTANEDTINLSLFNSITSFDQLNISQDGVNTVIDLSSQGGGLVTLENFNYSDLDADDFSFYVPPATAEVEGV